MNRTGPVAVQTVMESSLREIVAERLEQCDVGVRGGAAYRATHAEMGSRDLLTAMLRYGARHGLPNMAPSRCAEMLREMAA